MKKIFFIIIAGYVLTGCSKKELDTNPNDSYTENTYWTTEKNVTAALSGCYQVLTFNGIYGYATPLWEETATPNAYNYDNSAGFGFIAMMSIPPATFQSSESQDPCERLQSCCCEPKRWHGERAG